MQHCKINSRPRRETRVAEKPNCLAKLSKWTVHCYLFFSISFPCIWLNYDKLIFCSFVASLCALRKSTNLCARVILLAALFHFMAIESRSSVQDKSKWQQGFWPTFKQRAGERERNSRLTLPESLKNQAIGDKKELKVHSSFVLKFIFLRLWWHWSPLIKCMLILLFIHSLQLNYAFTSIIYMRSEPAKLLKFFLPFSPSFSHLVVFSSKIYCCSLWNCLFPR